MMQGLGRAGVESRSPAGMKERKAGAERRFASGRATTRWAGLRGRADRRLPSGLTTREVLTAFAWLVGIAMLARVAVGQVPYSVPGVDAKVLRGVDFARAQLVDPQLTSVYQACDQKQDRGGCYTDQAKNTVVLKFPDSTVFFDAKMAIDADGSVLSKKAEHPNQPETAFRYPNPAGPDAGMGPSLDSERVPYVVMPMGDFRRETGASLGDLVAVIKDGQVHFAIVGDVGPRTHIGEASMKLHMEFGRHICTAYDEAGNCSAFTDTSIDPPVLYFFFPDTRKLIYDGLTADNINERITTVGGQVWRSFLAHQQEERGTK